eukprot:6793958-Alexandrium_andersonii.AAC.1
MPPPRCAFRFPTPELVLEAGHAHVAALLQLCVEGLRQAHRGIHIIGGGLLLEGRGAHASPRLSA